MSEKTAYEVQLESELAAAIANRDESERLRRKVEEERDNLQKQLAKDKERINWLEGLNLQMYILQCLQNHTIFSPDPQVQQEAIRRVAADILKLSDAGAPQ